MDTVILQHIRVAPVRGNVVLSAMIIFILLIICTSSYAQSTRKKSAADTSKVVVTEQYWNSPEKKSALFDSSGRQLSTQQMVDFLKNELKKLNEQINTLVQKAAPDSGSASTADEVDVMKLFIIKGKLESLEKTLDEWMKQRELELRPQQADPSEKSPKGKL
jgi:hypothetical protein